MTVSTVIILQYWKKIRILFTWSRQKLSEKIAQTLAYVSSFKISNYGYINITCLSRYPFSKFLLFAFLFVFFLSAHFSNFTICIFYTMCTL